MSYADYAFYAQEYGGTLIPEDRFPALAARASETLDADTMGRAAAHAQDDALRRCCCALAELAWAERTQGAAVQKETLGSWSRSYLLDAADTPRARQKRAEELYLADSGMLYRGRCRRV